MFESVLAWVGALVGAALVAARTYRRGTSMDVTEQVLAAQRTLREHLWENRDEITDYLVLHDCAVRPLHEALLVLAGVGHERWIMGALANDRARAES